MKSIDSTPELILQKALLRKKELLLFVVPFSGSTLERKVRTGEFPAPIKLSPAICAWRNTDVQRWLDSQGYKSQVN